MKCHALIFSCYKAIPQRTGGSYRIATFLREEHDWDVEVIDYVRAWSLEELKEISSIRINRGTKFIGFSTFFLYWEEKLNQLIDWLKINYPDILIVVGGAQCQHIDTNADYFINGYGENAILALIKYTHSNTTEGIKLDSEWLKLGKRLIRQEYYPSYPFKSLLIKFEDRDFVLENEWLPIEFSRGCIFECKFCNFPILGVKSDYSRSAEDFERHIKDIYDRFGTKYYYVSDETFNDSIPKMQKFADVVDQLNFRPLFSGFARADLMVARKEDRELMSRIGFIGHFYGIETTNHETGKIIGKGMHPDRLLSGILEIRDYFKKLGPYRGEISLIVGLPKETEETARKTVDWILKNWQGENAQLWPFEIPIDPMYDKLHTIGRDPEKYGYYPSSVSLHQDITSKIEIKHVSKTLNWENENFTYARAKEFCINANKEVNDHDNRLGSWTFGDRMILPEYNDVYKSLEIHNTTPMPYPDKIIDNYKNNKFNA